MSHKIQTTNIAVIGRTGAGKSTLINAVFGSELAKTGTGLPVSTTFTRYPDPSIIPNSPVVLYDSAGYEMGKESLFKRSVFEFIEQKIAEGVEKQIHLVWYVIHTPLKRFEYFDADIVRQLNQRKIPTIIVLSQIDIVRPDEIITMEQTIREFGLGQHDIAKVAAYPIQGKPIGIKGLVCETTKIIQKVCFNDFEKRKSVSKKGKKKTILKCIKKTFMNLFASVYLVFSKILQIIIRNKL